MITGSLKWRAQERRRAEVCPTFMRARELTREDFDAIRQRLNIGPAMCQNLTTEPTITRIHFPQWRHIRARAA